MNDDPTNELVRTILCDLRQQHAPTNSERQRILDRMEDAFAPEADAQAETQIQSIGPRASSTESFRSEAEVSGLAGLSPPSSDGLLHNSPRRRFERLVLQAAVLIVVLGVVAVAIGRNKQEQLSSASNQLDELRELSFDGVEVALVSEEAIDTVRRQENWIEVWYVGTTESEDSEPDYILTRPTTLFDGLEPDEFFLQRGILATQRLLPAANGSAKSWSLTLSGTSPDSQDCEPLTPCIVVATTATGHDSLAIQIGRLSTIDVYEMPDGGSPLVVFVLNPEQVANQGASLELDISLSGE